MTRSELDTAYAVYRRDPTPNRLTVVLADCQSFAHALAESFIIPPPWTAQPKP